MEGSHVTRGFSSIVVAGKSLGEEGASWAHGVLLCENGWPFFPPPSSTPPSRNEVASFFPGDTLSPR